MLELVWNIGFPYGLKILTFFANQGPNIHGLQCDGRLRR